MQQLIYAGWPYMDCSEHILDRTFINVKNAARRLIEIMNQRGES
ncbi:MAG: protease FtsH-inhibitory lysogeny factor CIII [Yersinia sp. (in: enterobacteria)]